MYQQPSDVPHTRPKKTFNISKETHKYEKRPICAHIPPDVHHTHQRRPIACQKRPTVMERDPIELTYQQPPDVHPRGPFSVRYPQRCTASCTARQCVAACCSVLQCGAACCSVLQCVAACCSAMQYRSVRCV